MAAERDDLAQKGLEHLQAAAREVIQATRLLLDAAEELVEDPTAVQDLVGNLATVANAAAARVRATVPRDDAEGERADDDGDDPDDGRVHRIQVS
jgi:hypothetical protein